MIKINTGKYDFIVGVSYRPPVLEGEAHEDLCRQKEATCHLKALVLMWYLNHTDICWRNNTARHKQYRRLLKGIADSSSKWQRSQQGELLCWTSYSSMRELLWMWREKATLAAVTVGWWSSGSWGESRDSQFWTSGDHVLGIGP